MTSIRALHVAADEARAAEDAAFREPDNNVYADRVIATERAEALLYAAVIDLRNAIWSYEDRQTAATYDALIATVLACRTSDQADENPDAAQDAWEQSQHDKERNPWYTRVDDGEL